VAWFPTLLRIVVKYHVTVQHSKHSRKSKKDFMKEWPKAKPVIHLMRKALFLAASKINGQGNGLHCVMWEAEHLGELPGCP
jgi:hypothetical protein